jgi:hypothetical protein
MIAALCLTMHYFTETLTWRLRGRLHVRFPIRFPVRFPIRLHANRMEIRFFVRHENQAPTRTILLHPILCPICHPIPC